MDLICVPKLQPNILKMSPRLWSSVTIPQIAWRREFLRRIPRRTLARRGAEPRKIKTRCENFGVFDFSSQTLQEEQERELATEIEEERQIEKPSHMEPHRPSLHRDVKRFVMTGEILPESDGFRPALMALRDSSVARLLDLDQFRREILVTEDFVHTVKREGRKYVSDQYQRPVQWIVTSFKGARGDSPVEHMVVFGPWEVNKLLPDIRQSRPSLSTCMHHGQISHSDQWEILQCTPSRHFQWVGQHREG